MVMTRDYHQSSGYPSLRNTIWRGLLDLPHHLANVRDSLIPGDFAHLYEEIRPYTISSQARLRGLYRAITYVVLKGIPGDAVECGTAHGGSAALMGLTLKKLRTKRLLWIYDTVEGLPSQTLAGTDYEVSRYRSSRHSSEILEIVDLFRRYQILDRTRLVTGLFQVTLPSAEVTSISVLHLKGDWYESIKCSLESLYDRVSPGGIVQINDYGHWIGARKATDEFLKKRKIRARLHYLDQTGRYLIKPSS